jgi:hypothetical protein
MGDLRARAAAGEQYDLVALDPPPFARSRAEVAGAERGYRELNLRARCACSTPVAISPARRARTPSRCALRRAARRSARVRGAHGWLEELRGAARDHPLCSRCRSRATSSARSCASLEGIAAGPILRGSCRAHRDRIRLNGERRRVRAGASVAQLIAELDLAPERVAVERNGTWCGDRSSRRPRSRAATSSRS